MSSEQTTKPDDPAEGEEKMKTTTEQTVDISNMEIKVSDKSSWSPEATVEVIPGKVTLTAYRDRNIGNYNDPATMVWKVDVELEKITLINSINKFVDTDELLARVQVVVREAVKSRWEAKAAEDKTKLEAAEKELVDRTQAAALAVATVLGKGYIVMFDTKRDTALISEWCKKNGWTPPSEYSSDKRVTRMTQVDNNKVYQHASLVIEKQEGKLNIVVASITISYEKPVQITALDNLGWYKK